MHASIRDVAPRAGVSAGTVSDVLDRPAGVGAATRERVRESGTVRLETAS